MSTSDPPANRFSLNDSEVFALLIAAESRGFSPLMVEKFLRRIEPSESGCWLWVGSTAPNGYGKFYVGHRSPAGWRMPDGAHRVSYRFFVGEIPPDLEIDHLCRNTRCVHPFHLEAVDHRTNMMRADCFAARYAAQTHCKRGHEKTPENSVFYKGKARGCLLCRRIRDRVRNKKGRRGKRRGAGLEWGSKPA